MSFEDEQKISGVSSEPTRGWIYTDSSLEASVRTVPSQLVHRLSVADVFLTDARKTVDHAVEVRAQWPRRHHFYDVGEGRLDIVLVAETLRQATIFIAHTFYSVPFDRSFLMGRLAVELRNDLPVGDHSSPEVIVETTIDGVRSGSRGTSALTTRMRFLVGDVEVAVGVGELQIIDNRIYRRMRPAAATSDAALVREMHHASGWSGVELTRTDSFTDRWDLDFDPTHPVFFDHPVDHVPGMLIVEAARQAARIAAGGWCRIRSLDLRFGSFLDLDRRTTITRLTDDEDDSSVRLRITQADVVAVDITVEAARQLSYAR